MSLAWLRASLHLWRLRLAYRGARLRYWTKRHNGARVAKWAQLAREAVGRINLRREQIANRDRERRRRRPPRNVLMYDATEPSQIPTVPEPEAVAGYVDGRWPDYAAEVKRWPKARHVSITATNTARAKVLDIETGDATPADAPGFWRRERAAGVKHPVFYIQLSRVPELLAVLADAGITRGQYRLWVAHYTGVAHIEPGSDATQYDDKALGRNLDASLCTPGFFS